MPGRALFAIFMFLSAVVSTPAALAAPLAASDAQTDGFAKTCAGIDDARNGGRVVCAGIHMSDIPSFPYEILWEERQIVSVANLTRRDAEEFLPQVPTLGLHATVARYPLEQANQALADLREGRLVGAAVLVP